MEWILKVTCYFTFFFWVPRLPNLACILHLTASHSFWPATCGWWLRGADLLCASVILGALRTSVHLFALRSCPETRAVVLFHILGEETGKTQSYPFGKWLQTLGTGTWPVALQRRSGVCSQTGGAGRSRACHGSRSGRRTWWKAEQARRLGSSSCRARGRLEETQSFVPKLIQRAFPQALPLRAGPGLISDAQR